MAVADMHLVWPDDCALHGGGIAGDDQIIITKVERFDRQGKERIDGAIQFSQPWAAIQKRGMERMATYTGRQVLLVGEKSKYIRIWIETRDRFHDLFATACNQKPIVNDSNAHGRTPALFVQLCSRQQAPGRAVTIDKPADTHLVHGACQGHYQNRRKLETPQQHQCAAVPVDAGSGKNQKTPLRFTYVNSDFIHQVTKR
jgi:hypothetical protein